MAEVCGELFKFVGDTRVMILVIKELRQELLKYREEALFFLSIAVIQCVSLKKRELRRFQLYLKQCRVPTQAKPEHIGSGRSTWEDKTGAFTTKNNLKIREGLVIPLEEVFASGWCHTTGATFTSCRKSINGNGCWRSGAHDKKCNHAWYKHLWYKNKW